MLFIPCLLAKNDIDCNFISGLVVTTKNQSL
nr:MAG TPA: hypothetical protein [Bacteriophage sp.]